MRLYNHLFLFFLSSIIVGYGTVYGQTTDTVRTGNDAHVFVAAPSMNYQNDLNIPIFGTNSSNFRRYYLKFDLSYLPINAVIVSAKLRLKPNTIGETGVTSGSFRVGALTSSWSESLINYSNASTTTTGALVTTNSFSSGRREFDVTTLVQTMVNGVITNNGFLIRRDTESSPTGQCEYYSGENADVYKPHLVVKWYIPISITAATVVHSSTPTTADGSITPTLAGGIGPFSYKWFSLSVLDAWNPEPPAGSLLNPSTTSSPNLTNRLPGSYGLKVTSTTNGETFYYAFIIGSKCEPVNIDFYPSKFFTDDVSLFQGSTAVGAGASNFYETGFDGTRETVGLMRFRLWFDPGLSAVTANMYLTGYSHVNPVGVTNNAAFYLVNTSVNQSLGWTEMTTTYANRPSVVSTELVDLPATTTTSSNAICNIASMWNIWKTNNTNNNGMLSQLDAYGAGVTANQRYFSSEYPTAASRAYIKFFVDDITCDRTSYTTFKRELDAGYVTTFQGKLKIQFTEEYEQVAGKKVPLILYDENKTIKAAINYDGSAVGGNPLLPALTYQFDDNRHLLNLSTYSLTVGKFYILELTKSTGEKEYIRFIYAN